MTVENPYRFGPFLLDPGKRLLVRDGQHVQLYGKAFDTLLVLVRNADRLVKKEELLKEVWADRTVEENNLSQSISAVRKALGDTTGSHVYVVTVPGWGYRFAAPVSMVAEPAPSGKADVGGLSGIPPSVSGKPAARLRRLVPVSAGILVILSAVVFLQSRYGTSILAQNRSKGAPVLTVRPRRSIAIVGFQNLSGQKDDAWLSTALSEMLNTELAAGDQIRVVPQDDVARAKAELAMEPGEGATKNTAVTIGRRLGSDLLVSGSYSIVGDKGNKQVRFDLRLQNANSSETLVEMAETGSQSELFGLVSQAGSRLREKLNISELSPTETLAVRASMPNDADAARFYSEGLARLRMFDAIGAQDLLQKAIVLDPSYSLAHSALADAWSVLGYDVKSRAEAEKAFQLSGSLSRRDQLSVEGQYRTVNREREKAIEVYKTLYDLFPDDLDFGLHLATAQTSSAHGRDALATLGLLRRLPAPSGNDPRIALKEYEAWRSLGDFRHAEGALAQAADAAKRQGKSLLLARARSRQCYVQRIRAEQNQALANCREAQQIYAASGDRRGEAEALRFLGDLASSSDTQTAIGYYEQALRLEREIGHRGGEATIITMLATEHSSQGEHAEAKRSYEEALAIFQQLDDRTGSAGLMNDLGGEYLALGQPDRAEKIYRQALEAASAIGNKYIEGMTEYNLGEVRQEEGDLDGAKKFYTEALSLLQQAGSAEYDIGLTRSLGELAMAQGNLDEARTLYQKAMSMKQASQQKQSAAETEMDLDQLALEEGKHGAELEASLRKIEELFRRGNDISGNNALDDHALSLALLARCLQAEGRSPDAVAAIEQASKISAKTNPSVRLSIAVAAASIRFAASPRSGGGKPVSELARAVAEARAFHYVGVELEGRLAMAEVEMQSGARAGGRAHLQALEKDASKRGFGLVARKAKAAA
jgi:DNA-binding winged helix-turn-helix (wHTH) protein/tetratricopeptide (TPR) repeat protein